MKACTCGHSIEEHKQQKYDQGPCLGTYLYEGKEEQCGCLMYEEDPDA